MHCANNHVQMLGTVCFLSEPSSCVSASGVGWGVIDRKRSILFFSRHIPRSKSAFWDRMQVPGHHDPPFLLSSSPFSSPIRRIRTSKDHHHPFQNAGWPLYPRYPQFGFPSSPPFAVYRTTVFCVLPCPARLVAELPGPRRGSQRPTTGRHAHALPLCIAPRCGLPAAN